MGPAGPGGRRALERRGVWAVQGHSTPLFTIHVLASILSQTLRGQGPWQTMGCLIS